MSLSKEINAITECSICTETFVDPRVLPCVHTFCLKCLESYGKSRNDGNNLTCPICRANFEFPTSKAFSDLPINFFIQKLIDVNKIACGPSSNDCDACSEQNPSLCSAAFYCFDCRQNLCENCCQVHNKLRYNRNHQVVEFGKIKAEELLKVSPTFCEFHCDELVKFFCIDCDMTICMACYVEEHSAHKCSNIQKVSDEFLQKLETDTLKVSGHIAICLNEAEKLKKKKANFLHHVQNRESEVSEMVNELHKLADVHKQHLLEELSSIKNVKLKELQETDDKIHDQLTMMESFKRYSEEVMKKATPADITRLTIMLKKRAKELHEMRLDNDFCTFDIKISSSNIGQILTKRIQSQMGSLMVCDNRQEDTKAFSKPYTKILLPFLDSKKICSMTTLGEELYCITTGRTSSNNTLIGAEVVKLPIPTSYNCQNQQIYPSNQQIYPSNQKIYPINRRAITVTNTVNSTVNATQCDSMVFQLLLWIYKRTTGDILQLQVISRGLTESDGNNLDTQAVFDLQPYCQRRPSDVNSMVTLKAPQKLINVAIYGINFNFQITSTTSLLTVTPSVSFNTISGSHLEETSVTIPFSTTKPVNSQPSAYLEVFEMGSDDDNLNKHDDIRNITTVIAMSTLVVKLPDTFATADGSVVNRTTYTQCDSAMIHLQLSKSQSTSTDENDSLELKVMKLSLSDSGAIHVPMTTLEATWYMLKPSENKTHDIMLKSTQKLINNKFYGINFRLNIETTSEAVKIEATIEAISTANEDYPTEAKIEIPAQTQIHFLKLRRTINIPKTTDACDMVSCTYHQCIYIGDRHSSSILRMEPTGKISRWLVDAVPDGLATTTDHTLLVTLGSCSEVKEYDTNGFLLRHMKLIDLKDPVRFVPLKDNQCIIISKSDTLSLSSLKRSTEKKKKTKKQEDSQPQSEEITSKEVILFAGKETTFAKQKSIVAKEDDANSSSNPDIVKKVENNEGIPEQIPGQNETQEHRPIELKGPMYVAVDHFGFVFLLTASDAKVHLLSPQLNYLHELISLDKHGMSNPSEIHFDDESGILYVGSEFGYPTLLGFQVTKGKVNQSVWKN